MRRLGEVNFVQERLEDGGVGVWPSRLLPAHAREVRVHRQETQAGDEGVVTRFVELVFCAGVPPSFVRPCSYNSSTVENCF